MNKLKDEILCNLLLTVIANSRKIHRDYVSWLWKNNNSDGTERSVYTSIRRLLNNSITHTTMNHKKNDITSICEELSAIYTRMAFTENNGNLGKKI